MADPALQTSRRRLRPASCWSTLIMAGVLLAAFPSASKAQISPFRGYKGPALGKADLAAGQAAAGKLLDEDHAEVGKSEDWTGPTSGNTGTISVERVFQRQNMECRALRSEVRFRKPATKPRTLNLNVCRVQGQWKLM